MSARRVDTQANAQLEQITQKLLRHWDPNQIEYERAEADIWRLLQFCRGLQHEWEEVNCRTERDADPHDLNVESMAHLEDQVRGGMFLEGSDPEVQFDYDRLQGYLQDPECQWRDLLAALDVPACTKPCKCTLDESYSKVSLII